jgi:hypothetical protein
MRLFLRRWRSILQTLLVRYDRMAVISSLASKMYVSNDLWRKENG